MGSAIDLIWQRALRPLLFKLEPETAHRIVLALAAGLPPIYAATDSPELAQNLWGMSFTNPLGLAAGLDKDARALGTWQAIGFGFAEVGTITPLPQPGNPPPRLWRLPEHRALINRLGFPSRGAGSAAARLARLRRRGLGMRLGINLGPNRTTAAERVADDIAMLAERLGTYADFIVLNLSSPNTPGLREWQAPAQMRTLVARLLAGAPHHPPILVKLAPDLDEAHLQQICQTAIELGLSGLVAVNTTIARAAVGVSSDKPGGLSGPPLRDMARAVIGAVYRHTQGRIPIIGVGGIASAEDAYGHIRAGASLVELYTGLIYEGPGLPARIKRGIAQMIRRDGYPSIGAAVGKTASSTLPLNR